MAGRAIMTNEKGQLKPAGAASRKAYATPALARYGSLTDLTLGGGFIGNDGNTKCTGQSDTGDPSCIPS